MLWPGEDCDFCRGSSSPPEFLLPPPPLPPFLTSQMDETLANIFCNDISLHDTEMCDSLLMLDTMHNSRLAFRISNIIVICSAFFVITALLGILTVIRCKQRALKKTSSYKDEMPSPYHEYPGSNNPSANQALYEDIREIPFAKNHTNFIAPQHTCMKAVPYRKQSLQTIAVHHPRNSRNQQQQVHICATSGPHTYNSQNIYGQVPIYEELPGERDTDLDSENGFRESEDDFAEDESSLVDETQTCLHTTRTFPLHGFPQHDISTRTWNHQYSKCTIHHTPAQDQRTYIENNRTEIGWKRGLLISDISHKRQYYPEYCCKYTPRYVIPKATYDDAKVMLPIIKPLRIHPRTICATSSTSEALHQDSSFGSDSGYSNHTHNSYPRTGRVVHLSSADRLEEIS